MNRGKHTDFILSPITDILEDVISANDGIGDGIETYPISDYVMQSVFMKMTGFQEQKLKCICWELATNDYSYRYHRYSSKNSLGECSKYSEKKDVYKDLISEISKRVPSFKAHEALSKVQIVMRIRSYLTSRFSNSNLSSWQQKSYVEFVSDRNLIESDHILTPKNLFESTLQEKYELVYNHRNRCAHNTLSYQQNLPTLTTLADPNYRYDNYFVRFYILIILDDIFRGLYKIYLEIDESI